MTSQTVPELLNTTATTPRDPDEERVQYLIEMTQQVWRVCSLGLLVLGTLGNIMSIAVLSRKEMLRSNATVYLIVLSVSDILVLYTGLLRQLIRVFFHVDIRHGGNISCKVSSCTVTISCKIPCKVWTGVLLRSRVSCKVWGFLLMCRVGFLVRCRVGFMQGVVSCNV